MGITSSTTGNNSENDAEIYMHLANPSKIGYRPISSQQATEGAFKWCIKNKAKIIRRLSYLDLWEAFIKSQFISFALTPAELQELLRDITVQKLLSQSENAAKDKAVVDQIESEIKEYLGIIKEINEKDGIKSIDILAVVSSILLLNPFPLEVKIDQLFHFIQLNPMAQEFNSEDFLLALSSFERGISFAVGKRTCNELTIKEVAAQWITLADPLHRSTNNNFSSDLTITERNFFDFCTNRQLIVRRILEALSMLEVEDDKSTNLNEVADTINVLAEKPSGGDEWLANPAWKKTAERMVPSEVKERYRDTPPAGNMSLTWIHGYRGFDCRNNVNYIKDGKISFTAAAVSIVQDNSVERWRERKQSYFLEHSDDIVSVAVYSNKSSSTTLVASGEAGKAPAIYLCRWHESDRPNESGRFESLGCFKGSHQKGIAQLAFSADGKLLYSIGIEYSLAIYNADVANLKEFGKLIATSQGPKDRILHLVSVRLAGNKFYTCGEKHVLLWSLERGSLKQETCKLGSNKNKIFLSLGATSTGAITATSEGEFYSLQETSVSPISLKTQGFSCHKKAAINAIVAKTVQDIDVIISGDKDGKVVVWKLTSSSGTFVLSALFEFTVTVGHSGLLVAIEGQTAMTAGKPNRQVTFDSPLSVRALDLSEDGRKILVGTQSCEIMEYGCPVVDFLAGSTSAPSDLHPRLLVTGHFQGELWGLARRPITDKNITEGSQCCTVGDDGYLRLWNIDNHEPIGYADLGGMARAVDYSPDGYYIAVGFGGRLGNKRGKNSEDGVVKVYRVNQSGGKVSISQVAEIKEAKQWISVVKFSPDGNTLAVGSRDNSIYLYSVPNQYRRKAKFSKHNAGITQFDFSGDSKYVQSCCSGYELLFFDANTGAQVTDGATKLLGKEFATNSVPLMWSAIGIWSSGMDGTDINNVDRSPSGKLLATCDDFGKVSLFNWPAINSKGSSHSSFTGHSSHVTNVKWVTVVRDPSDSKIPASDDFLLSVGGNDKCLFQWKHFEGVASSTSRSVSLKGEVDSTSDDPEFAIPSGGDEFMAVKPWVGAIVSPTAWVNPDHNKIAAYYASLSEFTGRFRYFQEQREEGSVTVNNFQELIASSNTVLQKLHESGVQDMSAPSTDELELEYVYGYRGFDCRNNLFYVSLPQQPRDRRFILYYAASLGILLNCQDHKQSYFRGHNDDILSMAVHEVQLNGQVEQVIVATGQQGKGNGVFVWEVPSMQTLSVVKTNQKTVLFLQFSSNGRILVSIGEDKSLSVIDWKSQSILATAKMDGNVLFGVSMLRSVAAEVQFFTAGDKLLKTWTIEGRNVNSQKILTSGTIKEATQQPFLSVCEVFGKYVIGCEDGSLYVIPRDSKAVKARIPPLSEAKSSKGSSKACGITAMTSTVDSNYLITGGKDGTVAVWDSSSLKITDRMECKDSFNLENLSLPDGIPILAKQIQALSVHPSSTASDLLLLIGTRSCDVLEVSWNLYQNSVVLHSDKSPSISGIIMRSHFNEELWGVSNHPFLPEIATVADDKTLRIFDLHSHRCIAMENLGIFARSCCYNSTGNLLAVGFGGRVGKGKEQGDGTVRLYNIVVEKEKRIIRKVAERRDAKQWISDIKFSSDQQTVVVGAHDCKVYVYNVHSSNNGNSWELSLRTVFAKHNAVITHLDLSSDGRFLQSNCAGYEILFSDVMTGKQIPNPNEVKDVKWNSCTLGWAVQGIYSGDQKGSDINAACRSHTGHLLATSDDSGKVKLYRYPVLPSSSGSGSKTKKEKEVAGPQFLDYAGHSSHVMNLRWSVGDEYLVSVGGNDKCIFQWKHVMSDVSPASSSSKKEVTIKSSGLSGIVEGTQTKGEETSSSSVDDLLSMGLEGGGDESMAVKPWVGAVRPPKYPPPVNANPPTIKARPTWIHGYATNQRQNLFYNEDNVIIYPTAALAVALQRNSNPSVSEWSQTLFKGHDDDVLCIAMSADRRFIATGQIASKRLKGKASVIVWDALQFRQLHMMEACHSRGVAAVSFNCEGNKLLSVGMDDNCTHLFWQDSGGSWSRVQQIASVKGDRQATNFIQFLKPEHPMVVQNDYHFISGNQKTLNLWKIEGSNLTKKAAKAGKKCPANSHFLVMAQILSSNSNSSPGSFYQSIIGTSRGDMLVVEGRELTIGVEGAHKGPIQSLTPSDSGGLLVSGGKDGIICLWNTSLQIIHSYSLAAIHKSYNFSIPLFDNAIISLNLKDNAGIGTSSDNYLSILVGTLGGDVLEFNIPSLLASTTASDLKNNYDFDKASLSQVAFSHSRGELWGLATHPLDADIYATIGDDRVLRVWSIDGTGVWLPVDCLNQLVLSPGTL